MLFYYYYYFPFPSLPSPSSSCFFSGLGCISSFCKHLCLLVSLTATTAFIFVLQYPTENV